MHTHSQTLSITCSLHVNSLFPIALLNAQANENLKGLGRDCREDGEGHSILTFGLFAWCKPQHEVERCLVESKRISEVSSAYS